ncbi:MAG: DUF58 domain-containing protein [Bacillota bacterium]|nr:DUF58 domain-containing protein [Bacillota bacterium]
MLGILVMLVVVGIVLQSFSMRDRLGFRISDSLEYRRRALTDRTEPGEAVVLETVIANHSRIPVFQLTIREPLPQYAVLRSMHDSDVHVDNYGGAKRERHAECLEVRSESYEHASAVYLGGRQLLRRRTFIEFPMRGVYALGESELYHGDFIGFSMKKIKTGASSEVVVYPAKLQEDALVHSVMDYLGEVQREHTLYEDTLSTRGYRDYTSRDPMKHISWKQSARAGRLMTREFDRLGDDAVTVVYDLSYLFDGNRDRYISYLEFGYSLCRSLTESMLESGISFGFMTNAHTPDKKSSYHIVPGQTPITQVLELLGRTKSMALLSTDALLHQAAQGNKAIIYIGLKRTMEAERLLDALFFERGIRSYRIYAEEQFGKHSEERV